jgi:hypothetical protein
VLVVVIGSRAVPGPLQCASMAECGIADNATRGKMLNLLFMGVSDSPFDDTTLEATSAGGDGGDASLTGLSGPHFSPGVSSFLATERRR